MQDGTTAIGVGKGESQGWIRDSKVAFQIRCDCTHWLCDGCRSARVRRLPIDARALSSACFCRLHLGSPNVQQINTALRTRGFLLMRSSNLNGRILCETVNNFSGRLPLNKAHALSDAKECWAMSNARHALDIVAMVRQRPDYTGVLKTFKAWKGSTMDYSSWVCSCDTRHRIALA